MLPRSGLPRPDSPHEIGPPGIGRFRQPRAAASPLYGGWTSARRHNPAGHSAGTPPDRAVIAGTQDFRRKRTSPPRSFRIMDPPDMQTPARRSQSHRPNPKRTPAPGAIRLRTTPLALLCAFGTLLVLLFWRFIHSAAYLNQCPWSESNRQMPSSMVAPKATAFTDFATGALKTGEGSQTRPRRITFRPGQPAKT